MKRVHRRWHRLLWLLLTPAAAAVVVLALLSRAALPTNTDLPSAVLAPAATPGR
jgi:hypothetical protein